tara:strand:- start:258 stop:566 length:309 start_codon:yes stop_codon:yes gene_type:complete
MGTKYAPPAAMLPVGGALHSTDPSPVCTHPPIGRKEKEKRSRKIHFQLIKKHNNKNTIQKTSRATTLYLDMLYIELIVLHRRIFPGRRGSIQWTRILWRIDR